MFNVQPSSRVMFTSPRAALLAALLCACGASSERGEQGGESAALRAVPDAESPGHGALSEVLVGEDARGELALSVARAPDGSRIAYACDGEAVSAWYFGRRGADDEAALEGESGTLRLAPVPGGDGVSAHLTVDGATHTITLRAASPFAGPYRLTEPEDEWSAAWILLDDGRLVGLGSGGEGLKTREVVGTAGEDVLAIDPTPSGGTVETEEQILNRFRCGRLVLAVYRFGGAFGTPTQPVSPNAPFITESRERFEALGCAERGFVFPL